MPTVTYDYFYSCYRTDDGERYGTKEFSMYNGKYHSKELFEEAFKYRDYGPGCDLKHKDGIHITYGYGHKRYMINDAVWNKGSWYIDKIIAKKISGAMEIIITKHQAEIK